MSSHVMDDLPAYSLGSLDPLQRQRVEAHLQSCRECQRELRSLTDVVDTLALASVAVEPRSGLEESLFRSLPSRRRRFPRWLLAALVGTLAAVLAAGNLVQWLGNPTLGTQLAVARLLGKGFGTGTLVLDTKGRQAMLAVRGLAPGERYQLWAVHGQEWIVAGVFVTDSDGDASLAMTLPEGAVEAFCVSIDEGPVYRPEAWVLRVTL